MIVRSKNLNDQLSKGQIRLKDIPLPPNYLKQKTKGNKLFKKDDNVGFIVKKLKQNPLEQIRNSTQSEPQQVKKNLLKFQQQQRETEFEGAKKKPQMQMRPIKLPDL